MKYFDAKDPTNDWDFNQIIRKSMATEALKDADFAVNPSDSRKNTLGCRRQLRKSVAFDRRTNPERRKPRLNFKV